jgi:hypothetical protein
MRVEAGEPGSTSGGRHRLKRTGDMPATRDGAEVLS